jgi:hypothetical protein
MATVQQNLSRLFEVFRQMSLNFSANVPGQNASFTDSYSVIYRSATTFKVNVSATLHGISPSPFTMPFTTWVRTNGTVVAVEYSGQNMTGTSAAQFNMAYMAGFSGEMGYTDLAASELAQFLHETTKGTATFGPTTMNVTDYAANSLPFSTSGCGQTATYTEYSLQVGSIPSSPLRLITFLSISVSTQDSLSSTSLSEILKLISVTLA